MSKPLRDRLTAAAGLQQPAISHDKPHKHYSIGLLLLLPRARHSIGPRRIHLKLVFSLVRALTSPKHIREEVNNNKKSHTKELRARES